MKRSSIHSMKLWLAPLLLIAPALGAAGPPQARAIEITTGVVGLAPGQAAVLNVVDASDGNAHPLLASLALVDGDGNVLATRRLTLDPGKVQILVLLRANLDRPKDRVPIRGVVRLARRESRGRRPIDVTLELVDDATGKTEAVLACPSDFQFAGNAGGRGDVFNCPPPCTTKLIAP